MPTERFYRLAPEKKEAIRKAAFEEFVKSPWDKVSINRIIQQADISRGSFYTYFEDKKDVLYFILKGVMEQTKEFFETEIESRNGDIFGVMEGLFEVSVRVCGQDDWFAFGDHVMRFLNPEEIFGMCGSPKDEIWQYLFQHTNRERFRSQSQEDFHLFMELVVSALMISMRKLYDGMSYEKIQKDYQKKLRFIKQGVCI